ncbi:MAG: hypothetical protein V7L14_07025 [Nostoc sp.]|uniref:hypothetical protein n=1 Tax=Nostoc sp. TaxID=1180 RepID=UPI002FF5095D
MSWLSGLLPQHLYQQVVTGDRHLNYSVRSLSFLTRKILFNSNYSILCIVSLSIHIYWNAYLIVLRENTVIRILLLSKESGVNN